jgi:hypothetical protein
VARLVSDSLENTCVLQMPRIALSRENVLQNTYRHLTVLLQRARLQLPGTCYLHDSFTGIDQKRRGRSPLTQLSRQGQKADQDL